MLLYWNIAESNRIHLPSVCWFKQTTHPRCPKMAASTGLEPVTSGLTDRHSAIELRGKVAGTTRFELAISCVTGMRLKPTRLCSRILIGPKGTRTPNPLRAKQVLYQLSHQPLFNYHCTKKNCFDF